MGNLSCNQETLKNPGVGYLRIEKGGNDDPPYEGAEFELFNPIQIIDGDDANIFVCGGIAEECILAIKELQNDGLSIGLTSLHTIKPINEDFIKSIAKKHKKLITVEEHNKSCGLGSSVAEILIDHKQKSDLLRISIEDSFSSIVGDQVYLRKAYQVDSKSIIKRLKQFLEE